MTLVFRVQKLPAQRGVRVLDRTYYDIFVIFWEPPEAHIGLIGSLSLPIYICMD